MFECCFIIVIVLSSCSLLVGTCKHTDGETDDDEGETDGHHCVLATDGAGVKR